MPKRKATTPHAKATSRDELLSLAAGLFGEEVREGAEQPASQANTLVDLEQQLWQAGRRYQVLRGRHDGERQAAPVLAEFLTLLARYERLSGRA